jgi:hypothetical protein
MAANFISAKPLSTFPPQDIATAKGVWQIPDLIKTKESTTNPCRQCGVYRLFKLPVIANIATGYPKSNGNNSEDGIHIFLGYAFHSSSFSIADSIVEAPWCQIFLYKDLRSVCC